MGANGEVETVEQEDEGEAHPEEEEEEDEEVGNQLLDEVEEPIHPQHDDASWAKDPDYQPPHGAFKKPKKARSLCGVSPFVMGGGGRETLLCVAFTLSAKD